MKKPHNRPRRSHCKRGHPLTEDNIRLQKVGERTARMCRVCSLARNKRGYKQWAVGQRKKGLMYGGYTKGNIARTVSPDQVEQMFGAVRATGFIKAAYPVLPSSKVNAFLFFNPQIRDDLKQVAAIARGELTAAPIVVRSTDILQDHDLVQCVIGRINRAVSFSLSKDHRDDVVSDITLAWIEGRLEINDIERHAKKFVNKRFGSDTRNGGRSRLTPRCLKMGSRPCWIVSAPNGIRVTGTSTCWHPPVAEGERIRNTVLSRPCSRP
jgi:hypothetical protein